MTNSFTPSTIDKSPKNDTQKGEEVFACLILKIMPIFVLRENSMCVLPKTSFSIHSTGANYKRKFRPESNLNSW